MTFITLYRFRILPVGVVSKNLIGHCRMLESRPWWRRRDANQHPIATETAAVKANTAARNFHNAARNCHNNQTMKVGIDL